MSEVKEAYIDDIDRHYFLLCNCGCKRYFEFIGQLRTGMRIVGSNEKELNVKSVMIEFSEWEDMDIFEKGEDEHHTFACNCGSCSTEFEFIGQMASDIYFLVDRENPIKPTVKPFLRKNWRRYFS